MNVINAAGRRLPANFRAMLETVINAEDLSLKIVTDAEIKKLNAKYKKRNRPTDVLSFDTGDIVVSYDTAKRQAKEVGHSLRRELIHLAVHGMLHLRGRDDRTLKQREAMEKETIAILNRAEIR